MQHPDTTALDLHRAEAELQRRGPVELDPALLAFVAGGAPRSGWAPETQAVATVDAPRTGWL